MDLVHARATARTRVTPEDMPATWGAPHIRTRTAHVAGDDPAAAPGPVQPSRRTSRTTTIVIRYQIRAARP